MQAGSGSSGRAIRGAQRLIENQKFKIRNEMKKSLFSIWAIAAAFSAANAEQVKSLYSGEPYQVTWATTLQIGAEEFASDVKVGDYIYFTFENTTDVIELKADGQHLPGTRYTVLGDNAPDYKVYITAGMLDELKRFGMEVCGANFTVKTVSVENDGFTMPEGAIWGGYFWVDNWNTLELWKEAFKNYQGERYLDIYFSDDRGEDAGYFIKVMHSWDDNGLWADNGAIEHFADHAVVDLQNIDVVSNLANSDRLMIQGNKEAGNPFNIVALVLRAGGSSGTGIDAVAADDPERPVDVYNLQGGIVRAHVPASVAVDNLPAGLYIVGGKKVWVK